MVWLSWKTRSKSKFLRNFRAHFAFYFNFLEIESFQIFSLSAIQWYIDCVTKMVSLSRKTQSKSKILRKFRAPIAMRSEQEIIFVYHLQKSTIKYRSIVWTLENISSSSYEWTGDRKFQNSFEQSYSIGSNQNVLDDRRVGNKDVR
jgi:hypothetical protein